MVICTKVDNFVGPLFLLIIIRSGLLAEIRWFVSMSKFHRSLCVLFSRTGAGSCIYHYYYYYLLIRVFHISVSWWSFTGDWVTASLLKFPGLFSVFWLFSIMLFFGWFPLGRQLPGCSPLLSLLFNSFRVFHIGVSWWFFTGVWVTASLLKSPGLVSGFLASAAMLSFG